MDLPFGVDSYDQIKRKREKEKEVTNVAPTTIVREVAPWETPFVYMCMRVLFQ